VALITFTACPQKLHRDISQTKRGSVGSKWIAKLSDFGLANFLWHTNEQSKVPGNMNYAAPEL